MRFVLPVLLRLYPPEYRADFEGEMRAVFEAGRREHAERSGRAYAVFWARELRGFVGGAAREWSRGEPLRRTIGAVLPFAAGAAIAGTAIVRFSRLGLLAEEASAPQFNGADAVALMAITTVSLVLVSGFTVAFTLNLRSVTRRRRVRR